MVAHSREQSVARAARRLNEPRPASVHEDGGLPRVIGGIPVGAVREEWKVTERWWTGHPLRRSYFDVVLASGENVVVFRDEQTGSWFRQRA